MKKSIVLAVSLVIALILPGFSDQALKAINPINVVIGATVSKPAPADAQKTHIRMDRKPFKTLDGSAIGNSPDYELVGTYKIPRFNSLEWLDEEEKASRTGVEWNSFFDDLFIDRPGDAYQDLSKGVKYEVATLLSLAMFGVFNKRDGLVLEAKAKSFAVVSAFFVIEEYVISLFPKNHFCAKQVAAGMAGAFTGSFVITLPIN